mgnify:CR=1 FL=1
MAREIPYHRQTEPGGGMMCAVCLRGLVVRQNRGDMIPFWDHGPKPTDQHEPVPVPENSELMVLLCDFCLVEVTKKDGWVYISRPIALRYDVPGGATLDTHSDEFWAACEQCHTLIEANEWSKLAMRSVRSQTKKSDSFEMRAMLFDMAAELHDKFRSGRVGDAIREA